MQLPQTPLIDLRALSKNRLGQSILGLFQRVLDPLLQTRAINTAYDEFMQRKARLPEENFFDRALATLGIRYEVSAEDLSRIPVEGPVFLLANHPYGGVDGIIMGSLMERVRPDGRLLANSLLDRIDHMGGRCFYVNPFGGEAAARENIRGIKQSLAWLREAHLLGTFPAGEVSHLRWRGRKVSDPQWADNLAQLIKRTGATVVPVYFPGQNSRLFQILGLLHPRFRTALLPREMLALRGSVLEVRIGRPISSKRLQQFTDNRELMDFLRLRSYILQSRKLSEQTEFNKGVRVADSGKPIAPPQAQDKIEAEIADLGPEACLLNQGDYSVYVAKAVHIPRIVLELGRLREITFRAVGEGTGEAADLDRFDSTYWHLFVWNHAERELVGAYRMGLTDEILPTAGKQGLYTTTLFRFAPGLLSSLNPAIELGRSFIVEKYQRRPQSLALLWKGIGQFIVRNPRYKKLFGPVSISKDYQSLSKNLMVTYLNTHMRDPRLARWVRAKQPPCARFLGALDRHGFRRSVRKIEDVDSLIAEIESEAKGVPVLLRHYLKMNATVLSFNVDPAFNDCIDGLILVDLRRTAYKALTHYMGESGASAFLAYHNVQRDVPVTALP